VEAAWVLLQVVVVVLVDCVVVRHGHMQWQ